MKPLHDCTVVGLDYLTTAPTSITVAVTARATPAQVFAALEDAAAWPKWAPAIKKVTWTSPKPFGLGTTRTVDLVAGMVAEEEFIGWEPNRRMAFYFTRTSMPADRSQPTSDLANGLSPSPHKPVPQPASQITRSPCGAPTASRKACTTRPGAR